MSHSLMESNDVRRLHSSSLVDMNSDHSAANNNTSQSPVGSLKTNMRRPGLWSSFKAKIGSLSTSRSATNLSGLPLVGSDVTMSLCSSPPVDPRKFMQAEADMCPRLFPSAEGQVNGVAHSNLAPIAAASAKPFAQESSAGSSPVAIEKAPSISLESACSPSSATASSTALSSEPSLPVSPVSVTPIAVNMHGRNTSVCEPTTAIGRRLLALSPSLPVTMRRSLWSLEDYAISKRLFKGSSSAVYRATCRRSGLPVALKVYFLARVPSNVMHMLKREIEIHTQLVHKNIVRLHAAFLDEGDRVVLVQEYASNGDLYSVVQRLGGRMPPEQVADVVLRPFLDALAYLHSKGFCHRDIKPENLLFSQGWRLLIADFGVSINMQQERAVTRAGTEGYMAPEVERCPLKALPQDNKDDPRYAYSTAVDIWAVGVLAYEMMVGFPPVVLPASSKQGAMSGFVESHMTAAALHFPASVPPAARSFILSCLAADPIERPTAAQLLQHTWLQPEMQPPEARWAGERTVQKGIEPALATLDPSVAVLAAHKYGSAPAGFGMSVAA